MVKQLVFALLLVISGFGVRAQVVYMTEDKAQAGKVIFVTDNPDEADLWVYKTEWKSDATPNSGIWYLTEWRSSANLVIWVTTFKSEADWVVYYTTNKNEAGFKRR